MKVIAFDVFGTVVDFSYANHNDIKAYAKHIHQKEWHPLHLPKSWETLPAHPDSREGIVRLRTKFFVVTCSNGPLGPLAKLSKFNNISWDCIIPLEMHKVFKPDPEAYLTICDILDVSPSDVTMVTANKDFGDLEGSAKVGMKSILIRHLDSPIKNIRELAESLDC